MVLPACLVVKWKGGPRQLYQDGELCVPLADCRVSVVAQGPLGEGASWHLPPGAFSQGCRGVTVSEEEGLSDGTLLNELKVRGIITRPEPSSPGQGGWGPER